MTEQQEQPLSPIVPLLVAALVCDVAVEDPATKKKNLIGIFDQINAREFPALHPMSLYVKMTDAEGQYKLDVRFVHTETDEVLAKVETSFYIKDRLKPADFYIEAPPLPIPRAGRYEFQIRANSIFLGSVSLHASLVSQA